MQEYKNKTQVRTQGPNGSRNCILKQYYNLTKSADHKTFELVHNAGNSTIRA